MALSQTTIDVSLLPMNQQAPASKGPTGRVDRVVNGVVRKFLAGSSGPRLSIEQRPGLTPLSTTAFLNGTATTAAANPKMLESWRDQLCMVGGDRFDARSEGASTWEVASDAYGQASVAPYQITRHPLYSAGTIAFAPDAAAVGNVLCRVLSDATAGTQIMFTDSHGVSIRTPFAATGTLNGKVVSDGSNFWVFSQSAAHDFTYIQIFSNRGALLSSQSVAWGAARSNWDVGFQSTTGKVFLVTPTGATTTVVYASYVASVYASVTYTPATDIASGVAVIVNANAGNNIYIAGLKAGGDVKAYEIGPTGTLVTTYATYATAAIVGNIAGYTKNNTFDLRLAISVLQDNTAPSIAAINNYTIVFDAFHNGTSSVVATRKSLAVASRAFADPDGFYRVWCFYQSTANSVAAGGPDSSPLGAQPTFFALSLSSATAAVCGELEIGSAYAFYAASRVSAQYRPWCLPSAPADSSGVLHLPLCTLGVQTPGTAGFQFKTNVNDYQISPVPGQALATADALLVPGFQAAAFDGATLVEAGVHLAPDTVSITAGTGGLLTPLEPYDYAFVWRSTDADGNVIRSAVSTPVTVTMGAGGSGTDTKVTLVVASDRTTTRANLWLEVYRTFDATAGHLQGTELRKIYEVANTPLTDTITIVDTASDAVCATGEELYAQVLEPNPAIDHMPPPAFSSGCTFQDRDLVLGYDGAVWISGSRVEGEVPWYNTSLRVVIPTADFPLKVRAIDARIIVTCSQSLWEFPAGNFPNATLTAGELPTPQQLPFTTGATGPAIVTPNGMVYVADQGVWNVDRALSTQFIGAGVLDEIDSTSRPSGIAVSDAQRIYFAMTTDGRPLPANQLPQILVFDLIAGAWMIWQSITSPAFVASWRGSFCFVDFTNCTVRVEDDPITSTYTDGGVAIDYSIDMSSMGLGGASGWQRLWGETIFGEWKAPHLLKVEFTYDNEAAVSETFTMPVGVDPDTYRFQVRQTKQKNMAVEIRLSNSFTWPTLATIVSAPIAGVIVVTDVSKFEVGKSYSSQTGAVLDTGHFTVVAVVKSSRSVSYTASGGWTPTVGHAITHETSSLTPGNSFTVESVQLRIGTKPGLGRQPTTRRIAP